MAAAHHLPWLHRGEARSRRAIVAVLLVLLIFASAPWSFAQETAERRSEQTAQVLAHYPDLPIRIDTPAFRTTPPHLTSAAELGAYVDALATGHHANAFVAYISLGRSPGGADVPALLISNRRVSTADEIKQLGRPVVLVIGQQHGNEPAGAEAALAIASYLADGGLSSVLEKLSVVIIPRANPDGAAADTRENSAGADINRDHGLLSQPEIRLIHRLVQAAPPALVIDVHEFTVGGRWIEKLGGLQAVDLMVLSSTHPMTPSVTQKLADRIFQPAIEKAIAAYHLSSFVYHTTSSRGSDRAISVGGNAPGIARNAFGLMGAVSFLLETRGVGIGLDSYQRRVGTHVIAMSALLRTAALHADALHEAVAAARTLSSSAHGDIVIAHTAQRTATLLPIVDPKTGDDKIAAVDMLDTRVVTAAEYRIRPAGYIVSADRYATMQSELDLIGARTCRFTEASDAIVERYRVLARTPRDARAINPDRTLTVSIRSERAAIVAGAVFVPIDQAAGLRIALALEPDTPGSLSAHLLAPDQADLGVSRLPVPSLTPTVAAAMICAPAGIATHGP